MVEVRMSNWKGWLRRKSVYLLLIFSTATLSLVYQVRQRYTLDLGEGLDYPYLEGFHAAERDESFSWRWSRDRASLWFPGIGGNQRLRLEMRLSGFRPQGSPTPHLLLEANGHTLASFTPQGEAKTYRFTLNPSLNSDLMVQLESDTFVPGEDPRELGVMVDWARVEPVGERSVVIPSPLHLLSSLATIYLFIFILRWWKVPEGGRFLGWGMTTLLLAWMFLNRRMLISRFSPLLLASLATFYLAILGLDALLGGFPSRKGGLKPRQLRRVALVLLLALSLRLILALTPGYEADVRDYAVWSWKAATMGIEKIYLWVGGVWPADYPPLIPYIFQAVGLFFQRAISPDFLYPGEEINAIHRYLLRLPAIFADLLTAVLVFRAVHKRKGFRFSLLVTISYLFNPAVLFDSAYWGQTDAVHSLLILLSITLLDEGRIAWSWASMTLATQAKPQAYIFFPLVLILTGRKFGWQSVAKGVLGALVTFLVIISPFLYHGTTDSLLRHYFSTVAPQGYLSLNAHNLWWLLSEGNGWINDTEIPQLLSSLGVTFLTYRTIGLLLLGALTLLALYRLYNDQHVDTIYATAAFLGFAFFMLPTQMHENYMFAVLPLLCVVSSTDRSLTLIYAMLSLTFFSNMVLHDPAILDLLGSRVAEEGLFIARWANSGLNFVLLAFWIALFPWRCQPPPPDRSSLGPQEETLEDTQTHRDLI